MADEVEAALTTIQEMVTDRLKADAYTGLVNVLYERKGDIENDVMRSLGVLTEGSEGGIGACIIVMSILANVKSPNVPGPWFDGIIITAQVLENVVVNTAVGGTGKSALALAKRVAMVLHHFTITGLIQPMNCSDPTIVPIQHPSGALAYEVRFETKEANRSRVVKCTAPIISDSTVVGDFAPLKSIATVTSGASIYFCFSGYPRHGGTGVLLAGSAINYAVDDPDDGVFISAAGAVIPGNGSLASFADYQHIRFTPGLAAPVAGIAVVFKDDGSVTGDHATVLLTSGPDKLTIKIDSGVTRVATALAAIQSVLDSDLVGQFSVVELVQNLIHIESNTVNTIARKEDLLESDCNRYLYTYTQAPDPTIQTQGSGAIALYWDITGGGTKKAVYTSDGTTPELGLNGKTPNGTVLTNSLSTITGLTVGSVVMARVYGVDLVPSEIVSFTVI